MFKLEQRRYTTLPEGHPPVLCVVVDTEEEFDWNQPFSRNNTGTSNIANQVIAHERIYDKLGIVPTYVIDWPVATTESAWRPLKKLMDEGRCEIGTHLHPWVSPPHTEEVNTFNSYTGNLPPELEFEKIKMLTEAISANFQRRPTVFKAGRYGLGPQTFESLIKLGYEIDASIVPHTSFQSDGGPDFRAFNNTPFLYEFSGSRLLELPVTTGYFGALRRNGDQIYPYLQSTFAKRIRLGGIAARLGLIERIRLTPEGCTATDLTKIMKTMIEDGVKVLSLTYHSSSLAIGNTTYVKTQSHLRDFLKTIELTCTFFKTELNGKFESIEKLNQILR